MNASLVAKQFAVEGFLVSVDPFGSGNINDTFRATFRTTFSEMRFILQRIRRSVFPEPQKIMRNMRIVTDVCHRKLQEMDEEADRIWQLPKIIQTKDGQDFYIDADGEFWRAISNIASAVSYEQVQSVDHAFEAGTVLGCFQNLISDIPCENLEYVIPGFHVTPDYLKQMDEALKTSEAQSLLEHSREARACLRLIEERRDFCSVLEDAKAAGKLTLRATHGDPKIANILIDETTGKGTCIVDLDTIQPGLVHADIGDAVRSCCNPAGEDATDLHSVFFDMEMFAAIYKGYMRHAKKFFTEEDHKYLYDAVRILPLELGLRFFADYLAGNVYFKTRYKDHNLKRALVQLRLMESIESREQQIRRVIG
ncbi:MAG: aminoglycoside phosphotransferase family protein [Opitutae bacterium]|nr:aminoglycoside phosphotransferase family protein [Opitutae bacterium]MCD8298297.1 aminoglycoside phosphotransferase family protein [Opitutae bacterium]